MTLLLTPLARRWLADRRREAVAIITHGEAHTESQRRLAWQTLTGLPPHPRAGEPQRGDVMHIGDPADFDDTPGAA